ncbi:hypothetical protein HPP92_001074 [Vanilla planifolia]|uniref:valine--tRNA ligase n=1 Tax=Vanilla planifolia TaxID=51239 RepID=A0A835S2P1_VANPL|nr:hypothetical protein HPP92_001074 [Vanilla planifolia]
MPRFKARIALIDALKEKGLYKGAQKNEMSLGICSRSNDVVEPMIKPQWFVDCSGMAKLALNAVIDKENKKIEIIPDQYEHEWKRWLSNIRDWCISRQLWWGHRIPAWYVTLEDDQLKDFGSYNDHWVVGSSEEITELEAKRLYPGKKFNISQDPDVLDTWFSSGLFPLSVLGWPDDTEDIRAFYPTSVLETGHDILFFWVARMVMLGMKLGGAVPFTKVYLHPMIRDAHGYKMSKSLGNVIDPLEVINGISLEGLHKRLEEGNLDPNEVIVAKQGQAKDFPNGIAECGADALRFALISYTAQSDKINLDVLRVVGYRQWCNKLWNAIRFAMSKFGDNYSPSVNYDVDKMPSICKWILSVLNKAIDKTGYFMDMFRHWPTTASSLHALCYRGTVAATSQTREYHKKESIMISDYPSVVESWTNEQVESNMDIIINTVRKIRSLRPPSDKKTRGDDVACIVKAYEFEILSLASLSSLKVLGEDDVPPPGCAIDVVNEKISVFLLLQGILDPEAEREKLWKKREEIQRLHAKLEQKMSSAGYLKAPQHVQDEDMRKLNAFMEELKIIAASERDLDEAAASLQ